MNATETSLDPAGSESQDAVTLAEVLLFAFRGSAQRLISTRAPLDDLVLIEVWTRRFAE